MTPDGIGAPRKPDVVARDEQVLAAIHKLGKETGVRVAALREACGLNASALVYSLNRLQRSGKIQRRDGYKWWPL